MPAIHLETSIDAPPEIVFDAARDVTVHIESARDTGERAVAGVTHGPMDLGDTVTWEARHFGRGPFPIDASRAPLRDVADRHANDRRLRVRGTARSCRIHRIAGPDAVPAAVPRAARGRAQAVGGVEGA